MTEETKRPMRNAPLLLSEIGVENPHLVLESIFIKEMLT